MYWTRPFLFLVNVCVFWTLSRCPVGGQSTTGRYTNTSFALPVCSTKCPENKRCLQDNVTVVWDYVNGENYLCNTYKTCYGRSSSYVEKTPTSTFFPVRLKPVDIARGSSVYFLSKGFGGTPFSFRVYSVKRGHFLNCSSAGGVEVSNGLMRSLKVPARFLSTLGYKYFIASGNPIYSCLFGLRLHMNVKDATNCTGHPTLPAGSHLCSGKGICISDSFTDGMSCECCGGYTGRFCEEYDACAASPCKRGNCTDVVAGHREDFHCTCPKGYAGQTCNIDIDDCISHPCKNGGLCQDGLNSYTCLCPAEVHGDHCELYSNLCEKLKPCQNNGNCSRAGVFKHSYVCHCPPGFTGQNCSLNATTTTGVPVNTLSSILQTSSSSHILVNSLSSSIIGNSVIGQTSPMQTFSLVKQTSYASVSKSSFTTELVHSITTTKRSSVLNTLSGDKSSPVSRTESKQNTMLTKHFSSPVTQTPIVPETSQSLLSADLTLYTKSPPISTVIHSSTAVDHTQHSKNATASMVSKGVEGSLSYGTLATVSRSMTTLHSSLAEPSSVQQSGLYSTDDVKTTAEPNTGSSTPIFLSTKSLDSSLIPASIITSSLPLPTFDPAAVTSKPTVVSVTIEPTSSILGTTTSSSKMPRVSSISASVITTSSLPPSTIAGIPSHSRQDVPTVTMVITSSISPSPKVVSSSLVPTPPIGISSRVVTSQISYSKQPSEVAPSATSVAPSQTVSPTTNPPLVNRTCANQPCGKHGVCNDVASSISGPLFSCDCQYPTVGPVCTTDLELHFPFFNGKSYIKHKPITFGSAVNEFIISFRTDKDGTILYSGHTSYRDFIKLEVFGGKLRFSVDAGGGVTSVTSLEVVTAGNITAAIVTYDTRSGTVSMKVNNGSTLTSVGRGNLRTVQLYHALFIGGIIPAIYTKNKPDLGKVTPFVGCIRELEFNDRAVLLRDALDWQNISECDVPSCLALPCKNGGVCVSDLLNVNEYSCRCSYPYSGRNCEKKYACLVNICNGGTCLNTTSGPQCLCPFGKGGVSCNQDLQVNVPSFTVTNDYPSFLQYTTPRGVVDQLDIRLEVKLSDHAKARTSALLFYVGLHDHLSVGSDGDYLALGILSNRLLLQYNLGSGAANITSKREITPNQDWFIVLAGRRGRNGYLYVDNDDLQEASSTPPLVALNVFGHMYLGGIPDISQLNSEVVFKEGFRGTIKDPKIRTGSSNSWVPMTMKHSSNASGELTVVMGLNVGNERVNACVAGTCLNNGSCESLGASYFCRCPSPWSGMLCNDTAIPCREYNPCQGRSTCRMRDQGFTCDCPPGKAGKYCENDINITTPHFQEYSYMSFSLDKIYVETKTSLSIGFSPSKDDGILFYITRNINSLTGDFLSITLHDRFVYLIYNLGTGLAKCKSQYPVDLNRRNDVIIMRDTKRSSLEVNGNHTSCESRGPAVGLNVQSVFYLGGVPDLSQVQAMAYENTKDLRDFTGCVFNVTVNGKFFDLSERGALNGRNILNCDDTRLVF